MEDSDFQEMNFFYKDRMYVQTVSAASPKTLVYVDDSNFDKDLGMKPYSLIIHSVHITTHSTMLLHLMMKNELMNGYAEIHINNIIEMVLASADWRYCIVINVLKYNQSTRWVKILIKITFFIEITFQNL